MKTSAPSATDKQPYDTEKGNLPDLTDTQILIEEWIWQLCDHQRTQWNHWNDIGWCGKFLKEFSRNKYYIVTYLFEI